MFFAWSGFALADGTSLVYAETADGKRSSSTREVVRWTHTRLLFAKNLSRVAVGQGSILELELLSGREVLMLSKAIGRTSMMVWYEDATTEAFLFGVVEDLTVLRRVLNEIHPAVNIELAPDRAALILRGTVPTFEVKLAAERAVRAYLTAGSSFGSDIYTAGPDVADDALTSSKNRAQPRTGIINLLKTNQRRTTIEDRMLAAIKDTLGEEIVVRRIVKGQVRDDGQDLFILEGDVKSQNGLTKILSIASHVLLGVKDAGISVLTDEGGGIGGGGSGNIGSNVARAKVLSMADGRILSMLRVRNLPQVRVAVQIHEVNRSRLKQWQPELSILTDGYTNGALGGGSIQLPGGVVISPGDASTVIDNAFQVINGSVTNNLVAAGSSAVVDLLFTAMEEQGISQALARPTLLVLSGESATFQVGGEVPVPSSFSSQSGDTTNSVTFKSFGVTLNIRPLVDENNLITLDLQQEISQPDIALTRQIADSTGSGTGSSAFQSRSIQTLTQMQDGQPLIIGGLISRTLSNVQSFTPYLNKVPVVGALTRDYGKSDGAVEIMIVVTPTVVQAPVAKAELWQFPSADTLLDEALDLSDSALKNALIERLPPDPNINNGGNAVDSGASK
jgi:pilus assembly protein CpaC